MNDIMVEPWFQLDPNNYSEQWWLYSHIIDKNYAEIFKDESEIQCEIIIQDCNVSGIFWRVSTWYTNDPNRYSHTLLESKWNFSKSLKEMKENDILHLNTHPNIKFKVAKPTFFIEKDKTDFYKILERVYN